MTSRKNFRRPTRRVNPNPLGTTASISLKQYESMVIEPSIFGDCLGAHGDYTSGLFYGGRRKFLIDESEKLRPPSQFMTVKQKRNQILKQKDGKAFSGIAKLEFTKKGPPPEADGEPYVDNYGVKKAQPAKKQQSTITIEKYPSINPVDWEEVKQAGCTFYLHPATGVISPEKPWLALRSPIKASGQSSPARSESSYQSFGGESVGSCEWEYGCFDGDEDEFAAQDSEQLEPQWGCGSLAYDGAEMNELLSQLEGIPWSSQQSPR